MTNRNIANYFPTDEKTPLVAECLQRVRFNEVDSLKMVWHGHYINYFEQGRNEWGRKFGFRFQNVIENGFAIPIVQLHIDHFHPLKYDELIRIKTLCHWTEAAKINFGYEIYAENGILSAGGYTIQVYTDKAGNLMVLRPNFVESFFQKWDDLSSK